MQNVNREIKGKKMAECELWSLKEENRMEHGKKESCKVWKDRGQNIGDFFVEWSINPIMFLKQKENALEKGGESTILPKNTLNNIVSKDNNEYLKPISW